jgi:hypothetical protein
LIDAGRPTLSSHFAEALQTTQDRLRWLARVATFRAAPFL